MSQGILGDLSRRYGKLRPSPRDFFFALKLEKKAILNELRSGFLFRTQKIFLPEPSRPDSGASAVWNLGQLCGVPFS